MTTADSGNMWLRVSGPGHPAPGTAPAASGSQEESSGLASSSNTSLHEPVTLARLLPAPGFAFPDPVADACIPSPVPGSAAHFPRPIKCSPPGAAHWSHAQEVSL